MWVIFVYGSSAIFQSDRGNVSQKPFLSFLSKAPTRARLSEHTRARGQTGVVRPREEARERGSARREVPEAPRVPEDAGTREGGANPGAKVPTVCVALSAMGVVTAFGSARKGLALAARTVADAVDRELVTGTSEQERRAAKALQRDTERAIARKALTHEKSKRTDLSFVEETNERVVERQVTRSELVIGPASDPRRETFERDDGVKIVVADRTTRVRPNVWAPEYDADGRRVKPPSRGPKFDPPSRARACVVDVLAARDLDTHRVYVTLDLMGERVGETGAATRVTRRAGHSSGERNQSLFSHRFDASFRFAAAKRLSDDERLVATVRRKSDEAVLGAVTIPIDAVEDANDPFVRDKQRDASHVEAFWTRLADPPRAREASPGAIRVACYFDADAPGRIRVFVASCTKAGSDHVAEEEDGVFEKRGLKKTSSSSSRLGSAALSAGTSLRRAFASSASYVRVSLNRVDPGVRPKKDDRRRTETVYRHADGVSHVFDEAFVYEHVDPEGDSSVLLELFRENALGGDDDAAAQLALPVKSLPRARDGDAAARPRDRAWRVHSRSRRHGLGTGVSETATGDVCVAACFLDAAKSRLRVRVLEARDVRAGDKTGTSDAYVRATLLDGSKGSSQQVFHTKVVYGTTSPAWRHEFFFRVEKSTEKVARDAGLDGSTGGTYGCFVPDADPCAATRRVEASRERDEYETTEEGPVDVRGQAVALDLFDHDFDDFDADDFLGRVVLPLDAVATAGATSDAEKRTEWYPWRDLARANPPRGEVLIRAYFPFEMEGVETDAERVESAESVLDPAVSRNAAALRRRFAAKETHDARRKATRLELEKHGLRRELEAQLRVQLEAHDWPVDLATRYARAYAKHAHESHRIPPPPLGLVVPAAFAHMFETAERAAGTFSRENEKKTERDAEASGGGGINETRVSESAEEGSETRVFKKSAENAETPAPPNTDGPSVPSVPSWSLAAGGAASVYFRRSPTRGATDDVSSSKTQTRGLAESLGDSPWRKLHAEREAKLGRF